MTSPSTPSRSGTSHTSLDQSESPLSVHELTPRSKVKALLAAVDDSSDTENDVQSYQRSMGESVRDLDHKSLEENAPLYQTADNDDGTEEEESDEAPIAPRGRLVARLQGHRGPKSSPNGSKGHDSHQTPYDRIRNQLLGRAEMGTPKSNLKSHDDPGSLVFEVNKRQRTPPRLSLTPEVTNTLQSPKKPVTSNESGSESDLPSQPQMSSRLQLLVAQKKEERRAKETAEAQRNAEKRARYKSQPQAPKSGLPPGDSNSPSTSSDDSRDQDADRRLTQQTRPIRKATKKALEEMNRETQRMSRNMQLTHQARTKKKITKESFFTRFNFGTSWQETTSIPQNPSSSTVVSSAPASDSELKFNESLPTSPDGSEEGHCKVQEPGESVITVEDVQSILPSGFYILPQTTQKSSTPSDQLLISSKKCNDQTLKNVASLKPTNPSIQVHLPETSLRLGPVDVDSDSDLEIVDDRKPKNSRFAIFDRLPVNGIKEGRSLQNLRALAHMSTPVNRISSKSSITMSDMQTSLQQRARKQAAAERAEKIQYLKDKGVIIQSAAEREKDQAEVEDLVEKARKEANIIMEKEKISAKNQKRLHDTSLQPSSDEDEDYQGNDADQSDIDFSGSDEEDTTGDEQQDNEDDSEAEDNPKDYKAEENGMHTGNEFNRDSLIETEAFEDVQEEPDIGEHSSLSHDGSVVVPKRKSRVSRIIVENSSEDDETRKQQPSKSISSPVQIPLIPEIPFANELPMGMTQAFAATIADTQTQEVGDSNQGQDPLDFTAPSPPDPITYGLGESHQTGLHSRVSDRENDLGYEMRKESVDVNINFLQSQPKDHTSEDCRYLETGTQYSEIPDPTQDVGFVISPIQSRFVSVPPSTVDTVLLSGDRNSPVAKKKGRLRRGINTSLNDMEHSESFKDTADIPIAADAFNVLKKAARKPAPHVEIFDKTKSYAKDLVEEQAQESEDEYAGLGGASDDECAEEEDEEIRKMINEEEVDVDERKLAAFHANKERLNDEKAVEKLFKDLNNGGLRRKRGADFDLSDSDDDVEVRRRAKRREFAKMRQALLENENVGKIAEDPKKIAFLRAIEDREDDDGLEVLDELDGSSQENPDTQDSEHQHKDQATDPYLKRKRPLVESAPDAGNRPPPSSRRTRSIKKPSTLADIRASVSFLIEEPHAPVPNHQITSSPPSSDNESTHQHNQSPFATRRGANPVIDRLSLKRAESAAAAVTSRLAFHNASAGALPGGFKPPSLLRRATTSQLLKAGAPDKHGISTLAATERTAGGEKDAVKRGGSRKSSIGYFARERDVGRRVEARERKRVDQLKRVGRERSGLGVLATGSFE